MRQLQSVSVNTPRALLRAAPGACGGERAAHGPGRTCNGWRGPPRVARA